VTRGKPDPEVFLLAAQRIGVPPARCVVFEDAQVGIQAARAGGMKVIGVATTHPAATLRSADRVVHRLDELTVAELNKLF
jgi:beta-phosphoglucomutase-like phosphatase (HAD superfamily)